jgi:hypothetical protein
MRSAYCHVVVWAAVSTLLCGAPLPAAGETLISAEEAARTVVIRDLQVQRNGEVSGVLENGSQRLLRNVRLLIRHTWLWKVERAPQRANPGRAVYFLVPGEIPPGGEVAFTYKPDRTLPARSDGHFHTFVQVAGFTQVGE